MAVLCAGGNDIDPRGVDAAVAEYICEFCDVLLQPVKRASEQMPEIMRKYLVGVDVGVSA